MGLVIERQRGEPQLHLADRVAEEAHRRAQGETVEVGAAQAQRAHVGVEPLGDQIDDVVQGLAQVVRARDDLGDVRQK